MKLPASILLFAFMKAVLNPHGSDETDYEKGVMEGLVMFLTHTVQMKQEPFNLFVLIRFSS